MTPWLILTGIGALSFAAWWFYRRGKDKNELGHKSIELEAAKKAVNERNVYLMDVDALSAKMNKLHEETRKTFTRGATVGDIVRILSEADSKDPTPR